MNVNPFGGAGDDVYYESGNPLRIPKAYVHLVKTSDDDAVWAAQDAAAAALIDAMANVPAAADLPFHAGTGVEVIAQVPLNAIPNNTYRTENTTAGRLFVGSFGGQFRVLDGTCTHEGCFVSWVGGENQFDCPCHNARFAADGSNISGPPPSPLGKFDFQIQGANLEIQRPVSTAPDRSRQRRIGRHRDHLSRSGYPMDGGGLQESCYGCERAFSPRHQRLLHRPIDLPHGRFCQPGANRHFAVAQDRPIDSRSLRVG